MNQYILSEEEIDILIRQMLNIGEAMYRSGAEINVIENTLHNLGRAYGAEHVNVFAITSSIVLTLEFSQRRTMTQSRRIRLRDSINLSRLEKLTSLCDRCTREPMPIEQLKEETLAILAISNSSSKLLIGELIAVGGFTAFFGGTLLDVFVASIGVCVIFLLQRYLQPLCSGQFYFNAITSFLVGMLICIAGYLFPILNPDMIMIGDIMVLIPGIATTNSLRYTIKGDSISGVEKLLDSILQAFAIAIGFSIALMIRQHF